MPIFNESRQRRRHAALERLKTLTPRIEQHVEALHQLIAAYNDTLVDVHWLRDEVLDDMEAAQEHGTGNAKVDFARHLWDEQDFAPLSDVDLPWKLDDADRLERLPTDV